MFKGWHILPFSWHVTVEGRLQMLRDGKCGTGRFELTQAERDFEKARIEVCEFLHMHMWAQGMKVAEWPEWKKVVSTRKV